MNSDQTLARDPQASFTLTEVVVGVMILLLVSWALLYAFVSAKRSDGVTQAHLAAQQIIRSEAEKIHTNSYSNIVSFTNIAFTNTSLASLGGVLNCTVTDSSNTYKDVRITVQWIEPASSRRQTVTNFFSICDPD